MGYIRSNWNWIVLALLVVGCFCLRVLGQLDTVFVDGQVWFREVDGWYHMRLVDNMLANFPVPLLFDQYNGSEGSWVGFLPLMSWLIAGLGKLGFDINIVGAYFPPAVGSLCLIPIFLTGRRLFGKAAGLLACFFCCILPSEFFHRSLLGFTDHHILEAFLSLWYTYLILKCRDNWRWSIPAGLVLSMYLLNWTGGLLLVILTLIYLLYLLTTHLVKRVDTEKEIRNISITLAIGCWVTAPLYYILICPMLYTWALIATPIICLIILLLYKKTLKWFLYTLALGVAVFVPTVFLLDSWEVLVNTFLSVFWGFGTTIEEAEPTSIQIAFYSYGIIWILTLLGIVLAVRRGKWNIFLFWSLLVCLMTIGQIRWGYYSTIPIAMYAMYFLMEFSRRLKPNFRVAIILVTCFYLVLSVAQATVAIARLPSHLTNDWIQACEWLKDNTEEPFKDGSRYNQLGITQFKNGGFEKEYWRGTPNYYVLTWWDYGHWVIRISQRPVLVSPTQQVLFDSYDSKFYTYQSQEESEKQIQNLRVRYIIIDKDMVSGKFYALLARYRPTTEKDVKDMYPNSTIVKLWNGQLSGYKEVYRNETIKIYEVEKWKRAE